MTNRAQDSTRYRRQRSRMRWANSAGSYTQILVTNNTKQAARVSHRCAFFLMGEMVELDDTTSLFTAPKDKRTDDYITGRFG